MNDKSMQYRGRRCNVSKRLNFNVLRTECITKQSSDTLGCKPPEIAPAIRVVATDRANSWQCCEHNTTWLQASPHCTHRRDQIKYTWKSLRHDETVESLTGYPHARSEIANNCRTRVPSNSMQHTRLSNISCAESRRVFRVADLKNVATNISGLRFEKLFDEISIYALSTTESKGWIRRLQLPQTAPRKIRMRVEASQSPEKFATNLYHLGSPRRH